MLNNILEISRRKTHFWMNDNDKFWSFPVSLNINVRKNKSEEIFKENKKIADSLSKCKGTSDYSVKKLLAQADANDKRKNMITKKRKHFGNQETNGKCQRSRCNEKCAIHRRYQ